MTAEKLSFQKGPSRTKQTKATRLFAVAALICFGLGLATLLPWNTAIPNRAGYYTLCSYAPTSSVALLVAGFSLLFRGNKMRKMFLLSVIFLATIFVYTGYYAYAMKMPIDGLQVTLVEYHVSLWGYSAFNETHNITGIYFKFTIHNPTNVQTPPFEVDMSSIYVNGKELDPLTFTSGMAESSGHYFPISQPMTLKPNETYTYDSNNTEPM